MSPEDDGSNPVVGPLRRFAAPPKAPARNNLARRLETFSSSSLPDGAMSLSEAASKAVADAVEDPGLVRSEELDRIIPLRTERGTLYAIRTNVCALRITPFVVNPRIAPLGRHPAAMGQEDPEDLSYWAPSDLTSVPGRAELALNAGTEGKLTRVVDQHQTALRADRHWMKSIRESGVRRPITLSPLYFDLVDADNVMMLTSIEGSTRVAEVHAALGLRGSHEVIFGQYASLDRVHERWRELHAVLDTPSDEVDASLLVPARCLFVPAEIIIGFLPDPDHTFVDAIDGYLTDEHINPRRAWVPTAQNEKIGDQVLKSLLDQDEIDSTDLRYLAGRLSTADAEKAERDPWPTRRAAAIARHIMRDSSSKEGRLVGDAMRAATASSRSNAKAKAEIASTLAYRAVPEATTDGHKDARSALSYAYASPSVQGTKGFAEWEVTSRTPDQLRTAALEELESDAPGPAAIEMQVMAAFALARHGILKRGRSRNAGGDPDDPGVVLGRLTERPEGIQVYYRVLKDDLAGVELARPDLKTGEPRPTPTGENAPLRTEPDPASTEPQTPDKWIRDTFRPGATDTKERTEEDDSSTVTSTPPISPESRLDQGFEKIDAAIKALDTGFEEIYDIEQKGKPFVEEQGIDPDHAEAWLKTLNRITGKIGHLQEVFSDRHKALRAETDASDDEEADHEND